jgi:hypothetical protein
MSIAASFKIISFSAKLKKTICNDKNYTNYEIRIGSLSLRHLIEKDGGIGPVDVLATLANLVLIPIPEKGEISESNISASYPPFFDKE